MWPENIVPFFFTKSMKVLRRSADLAFKFIAALTSALVVLLAAADMSALSLSRRSDTMFVCFEAECSSMYVASKNFDGMSKWPTAKSNSSGVNVEKSESQGASRTF